MRRAPRPRPMLPPPSRRPPRKRRPDGAFSQHLAAGQKQLDAKQPKAAVAEFEAALQLFPGNKQATDLLSAAKKAAGIVK